MKKEFESEKYILLYGIGGDREHYRTTKTNFSEKVKAQEDYNEDIRSFYIDTYNEAILWLITHFSLKLHEKEFYEEFMEKWSTWIYGPRKTMFLWEKYHEAMKTKEKFMLENIFPHSNFAPGKEYKWHSIELRDPFIKRSCKIGIEAVKRSDNIEIWFILDTLDMEQVVRKSRESIVNSELRYIYRNWKELEQKVVFLYKDQRVPAPWVKEPKLWQIYERTLSSKNEASNPKRLKDLVKMEEKELDSPSVKKQRKKEDQSCLSSIIGDMSKRVTDLQLDDQTEMKKVKISHSR